ncbi:hypothetical protein DEO72_LG1g1719 [Vigna unguiculata]|uniref:Uncharacterized protein n=1 Tax=Vigna unguiculata TaxID=3917 RepID=A0A4D6KN38_VIGUN|nr:hypothetical protein DEO72_LG1g1719 [Vigna unguiculata]
MVCVIVECMEEKKMRWFGVWWSRNAMKAWLCFVEVVASGVVGRRGWVVICISVTLLWFFERRMAPVEELKPLEFPEKLCVSTAGEGGQPELMVSLPE